jgi:hypothetical protein
LAIVLVVIGFIVGGIFVGRTMLRQSQINSVQTDAQKYISAALNFQQHYGYLPGDMPTATNYWGTATGCPNVTTGGVGIATCNGSGNGQIAESSSYYYEMFTFWQHLSAAKMIDGLYTGYAGTAGTSDHVIGTNCPAAKLENTGFGIIFAGLRSGDTNYFNNNYGHVLLYGKYLANNLPVSAAISGSEASALDSKFDDGAPSTGQIETWQTTGYTPNCTALNASNVPIYKAGENTATCSIIFVTGF